MSALEAAFRKHLRACLQKRGVKPTPTVLPLKEAAKRLKVTLPEARELIAAHILYTVTEDQEEMVPVSEIERLLEANPPKPLTLTELRVAKKLSRLTTPGGPAALQRLRSARGRSPTRS